MTTTTTVATLTATASAVKAAFISSAKADRTFAAAFAKLYRTTGASGLGAELAAVYASIAADGERHILPDSFRRAADRQAMPGTAVGDCLLAKPVWLIDSETNAARVVVLANDANLATVLAAGLPTREQNKMAAAWAAATYKSQGAAAVAAATAAVLAELGAGQNADAASFSAHTAATAAKQAQDAALAARADKEQGKGAGTTAAETAPAFVEVTAAAASEPAAAAETAEQLAEQAEPQAQAEPTAEQLLAMLALLPDAMLAEIGQAVKAEQTKRKAARASKDHAKPTASKAHGKAASDFDGEQVKGAFVGSDSKAA